MLNSGYSPRHSSQSIGTAVRAPQPAGRRMRAGIVIAMGVALLGIILVYSTVGGGSDEVMTNCHPGSTGPGCSARPAPAARPAAYLTGTVSVRVLARTSSYHFHGPSAVATDGASVWVTNVLGNSVTAFSASSSGHVRNLPETEFSFDGPNALAIGGGHVWVANVPADTVTELTEPTGRQSAVLSAGYRFSSPYALALAGQRLWVADAATDSLTEVNTATRALIGSFDG